MKTLSEEDKAKGWKSIEEKEEFEAFYISDCIYCHSTSCAVFGGWKTPCYIANREFQENKKASTC